MKKETAPRDYAKRYIYFIVDGQNVLKPDNFIFSYMEVNDRMNGLVS
jgi:hypothetical protein